MPPPTRKKVGLAELRVGLLVLIALAVLIILILNASGSLNPFARSLQLRARFTDANGLRDGSEVRLAGVRIGKVDRIRLMTASEVGPGPNPQKVEVYMTINATIDGVPANDRIRNDSTAQQASPSLLGSEMMVNITPGTSLGAPVKDGDLLRIWLRPHFRCGHQPDAIDFADTHAREAHFRSVTQSVRVRKASPQRQAARKRVQRS